MFESERFIAECRAALREANPHGAIREVVAQAVATPSDVLGALGEPVLGGIQTIHHSADLTILNVLWAPGMSIHPHNHKMWAVIGIYGGREDNAFYQRTETGLAERNSRQLDEKDAAPLGENVIHAVHNPLSKITAAIHVYGGDFFAMQRSEWDPITFEERPYDMEHTRRVFEEANEVLRDNAGQR